MATAFMLFGPMADYGAAAYAVWRATKRGELPKLHGSIACVDCGAPAKHYDHRNYFQPLLVQPVCQSCNFRRGPGFPKLRATKFEHVRTACMDALRAPVHSSEPMCTCLECSTV